MADIVKEILSKPIQCADEIIKSAGRPALSGRNASRSRPRQRNSWPSSGRRRGPAATSTSDPPAASSTTPSKSSIRLSASSSNAAPMASAAFSPSFRQLPSGKYPKNSRIPSATSRGSSACRRRRMTETMSISGCHRSRRMSRFCV
ncbi:UNVERIFIED_CONTAM: hypothetical protein Sradi_4046400 [Sesamum radiatum]|uniref:Uncharacterized protein n=1 Tax=Sesamum radiatum TaxID=300843 RepID=A0AAW2PI83_SESRA